MNYRLPLIFLFAQFWLGIEATFADIIVTSSNTAPSGNVIASFDPDPGFSNAYFWRWIGNSGLDRVELGQSFLVPNGSDVNLESVTLKARDVGSSALGQGFTLEIWRFTDALDTTGDSLISSQVGSLPMGLTNQSWWTFDVADVTLQANNHYGFLLGFNSGPDPNRQVLFVQDFVSGYNDGRLISRAGTPPAWDFGGNDLFFYVQATAVPEPSSVILLSSVLSGWLFRRKRK